MTNSPAPASSRLLSIDALRGFDMRWILGAEGFVLAVAGLNSSPIAKAVRTPVTLAAY